MALPPEPSLEGLPTLEVFGAELEDANGEYVPTKYSDLRDGYFETYWAPHSGKPTWQRCVDGKAYILIFFNAQTTARALSSWNLYVCDDSSGHGLYQQTSQQDGMLPPENGWLVLSGVRDDEPAPLLSVREPRPPLLVSIGPASGSDCGDIACKSYISGDQIALFPGKCRSVKDIKTHLMARFRQYVVIMMPSGALTEDQEKFGSFADIVAGKVPEESAVQARRALLESVRRGGKLIQEFSKDELADPELVLAAIEYDGLGLEFAPEEMRRDSSVVSTAIKQRGDAYVFAMGDALEDRSIALTAVSQSGELLGEVGTKLLMDEQIVHAACKQNPDGAWPFVPQSMRQDKELFSMILEQPPPPNLHDSGRVPNVEDFQSLCDTLLLQKLALRRKPSLFQHALPDLRADRPFVLALLPKASMVELILPYVSEELKGDPEVALQAIKCGSPAVLSLVAPQLRLDRSFILQVLAKTRLGDGCFFKHLPRELADDREIAIAALERKACNTFDVLTYVSADLRQDKGFLVVLIQKDKTGLVFKDLSESLRGDVVLAEAATRSCLNTLEHVSGGLRADPEFVMSVMAAAVDMGYTASDVMQYAAGDLKTSEEFCEKVKEAYPDQAEEEIEFDMFG